MMFELRYYSPPKKGERKGRFRDYVVEATNKEQAELKIKSDSWEKAMTDDMALVACAIRDTGVVCIRSGRQ